MHSVTDRRTERQTDGWHFNANSLSYRYFMLRAVRSDN